MTEERTFPNTVIAVTPNSGLRILVKGDTELCTLMDGDLFEDNCGGMKMETFPKEPGLYRATVYYWFEQGYYEGYKADGESEWDFELRDVQEIDLEEIEAMGLLP